MTHACAVAGAVEAAEDTGAIAGVHDFGRADLQLFVVVAPAEQLRQDRLPGCEPGRGPSYHDKEGSRADTEDSLSGWPHSHLTVAPLSAGNKVDRNLLRTGSTVRSMRCAAAVSFAAVSGSIARLAAASIATDREKLRAGIAEVHVEAGALLIKLASRSSRSNQKPGQRSCV
jgi:hypothetical protein